MHITEAHPQALQRAVVAAHMVGQPASPENKVAVSLRSKIFINGIGLSRARQLSKLLATVSKGAYWMRYAGIAPALSYIVQKSSLLLMRAAAESPVIARRHIAINADRTCTTGEDKLERLELS